MLALGLFPDGTLDLGGVVEVLTRPRVRRVLWFTLWSAGAGHRRRGRRWAARSRSCCTGCGSPAATLLRALVVVPFVLPTVVVGVAFRQLIAPTGPLGVARPRRHRGRDRRRARLLQHQRRGPHGRGLLGGDRPPTRGGRGRARGQPLRRCSAR